MYRRRARLFKHGASTGTFPFILGLLRRSYNIDVRSWLQGPPGEIPYIGLHGSAISIVQRGLAHDSSFSHCPFDLYALGSSVNQHFCGSSN